LKTHQSTEVYFASLFSGGFITAIVVKPPEKKLAKRTSVHCGALGEMAPKGKKGKKQKKKKN
jgi:hypothetical protein